MKKNKYLPYVIFGVPILLGGYLLYKYATKPKLKDTPITPQEPSTLSTPSTPSTNYSQKNTLPLKKGNKGGYVVAIQKKLGISADGIFGSGTATSVANFQVSKGLPPDGIVGAKTWKALFGTDFPNTKTSLVEQSAENKPKTLDEYLNPYTVGGF